jgi:hypothetical protein
MASSNSPSRRPGDPVSPILFLVILALIIGFIAAFLILRPAGGGTRQPPAATQLAQPTQR